MLNKLDLVDTYYSYVGMYNRIFVIGTYTKDFFFKFNNNLNRFVYFCDPFVSTNFKAC